MRYAIDPSKIAKELGGFATHIGGVEKTIRWYLENQDWVEEVVGEYQKYYEQMYSNR